MNEILQQKKLEEQKETILPTNEGEYGPKHQIVYVVLALFFGFLGVHNFYIGRWKRGLVQLLLTVGTLFMAFILVEVWVLINMFAIKTDGKGRLMHPSRTAQIICGVVFTIILIFNVIAFRKGFVEGYSNEMARLRVEELSSYARMVQVLHQINGGGTDVSCSSLMENTTDMNYDCIVRADGAVVFSGLDDEFAERLARISLGTKIGQGKVLIPAK